MSDVSLTVNEDQTLISLTLREGDSDGFADPMTTAGDLITRNAANETVRLPIGILGQSLGVVDDNGTPVLGFFTPAGGGGSPPLLAAANLSDLDNAAIARQNLDVEQTNIYNEVPSGMINGSNATFTTAQAFVPESIRLTLNGLKQIRGGSGDFNNTDAQTIVFSTSPQLGDQILIDYRKA